MDIHTKRGTHICIYIQPGEYVPVEDHQASSEIVAVPMTNSKKNIYTK